jgi:ubiquitin-conjugating enzyme E2 O
VPLQRLTRLYDGLEQLEDMLDEGFSEEGSSMEDAMVEGEEWSDGVHIPPLPLHLGTGAVTGGDGDGDEDEYLLDAMTPDTMDTYVDMTELDPPQIPGGLLMDDASITPHISTTPVPQDPSTPQPTSQPHEQSLRDSENDDLYWKRFDVLTSAPRDHAFYSKPVAQPSRAFMARLHKEYRALSTGLPGMVISVQMDDTTLISYQLQL